MRYKNSVIPAPEHYDITAPLSKRWKSAHI
jgi:hypothetical protein